MKTTHSILESIVEKGNHEINREKTGLFLSSLSAGLEIGFGPLLMAVILGLSATGYGNLGTEIMIAGAYSVGFMFVILGRSELFTEHNTVAAMPVIDGTANFKQLGRVWGIVWSGNILGGLLFTGLALLLAPGSSVIAIENFGTIAYQLVHNSSDNILVGGIFAGWLMGLLAWLLYSAQSTVSRIIFILVVTATIGMLHLPHSIAGNVEVLLGLFTSSEITTMSYIKFIVFSSIGNAFGGAVFVGLMKHSHIVRGAD